MSKRGAFKDLEGEKEHVYMLWKIVNLGRKRFTGSKSLRRLNSNQFHKHLLSTYLPWGYKDKLFSL